MWLIPTQWHHCTHSSLIEELFDSHVSWASHLYLVTLPGWEFKEHISDKINAADTARL
jgi:hypothetical protein